MPIRTLQTIALIAAAAATIAAIYCGANGIRSIQDFFNYCAMRSVDAPIVAALANGTLPAGASTQEMLAIASPEWSEKYGRCMIYGFTAEGSFDRQTIVTINDRVVSAYAGGCTWHWTFYDNVPDNVAEAVETVRGLRDTMERMPEYSRNLQPQLDQQLKFLGVQVDTADNAAQHSAVPVVGVKP